MIKALVIYAVTISVLAGVLGGIVLGDYYLERPSMSVPLLEVE